MAMFPILILFLILGARINSTYDEKLIFKKHLIIKNPILSKLLIDQSKVNSTAKNIKANRNKLTLVGLIFYILIIILLMLICYMLLVIPPIQSSPFEINTRLIYIYTKTLNQKISVIITIVLFLFEISFFIFNTHKTFTKKSKSKAKIKNKE